MKRGRELRAEGKNVSKKREIRTEKLKQVLYKCPKNQVCRM